MSTAWNAPRPGAGHVNRYANGRSVRRVGLEHPPQRHLHLDIAEQRGPDAVFVTELGRVPCDDGFGDVGLDADVLGNAADETVAFGTRDRRVRGRGSSPPTSCPRAAARPRRHRLRARPPARPAASSSSMHGWNGIMPTGFSSGGTNACACAASSASTSSARRPSTSSTPAASHNVVATSAPRSASSVRSVMPLCTMTPSNRPDAAGDASRWMPSPPPAESPNTVTRRDRHRTRRCCRAPTATRRARRAARGSRRRRRSRACRGSRAHRAGSWPRRRRRPARLRAVRRRGRAATTTPSTNDPPWNQTITGSVARVLRRPHVQREATGLVVGPTCMPGTMSSPGNCGAAGPNRPERVTSPSQPTGSGRAKRPAVAYWIPSDASQVATLRAARGANGNERLPSAPRAFSPLPVHVVRFRLSRSDGGEAAQMPRR